jgi:hypothetical protein
MAGLLQINDPGRRTRARRLTFDPPCQCPAAIPVFETPRGSGVHCGVEDNTLTAAADPSSLESFCFGQYVLCPSWEQAKRWEQEGRGEERDKPFAERQREYAEMGVHVERSQEVEVTHYHYDE